MQKHMNCDYSKNIRAFFDLPGPELVQAEGMFDFGWWLWPIGRYVERYGNEDYGQRHFMVQDPNDVLIDIIELIPPVEEFQSNYTGGMQHEK